MSKESEKKNVDSLLDDLERAGVVTKADRFKARMLIRSWAADVTVEAEATVNAHLRTAEFRLVEVRSLLHAERARILGPLFHATELADDE